MQALRSIALALCVLALPAFGEDARRDTVADIGSAAEPAAVAILLGLFEDDSADPLDRMEAAWALGEIGDVRAVPALLAALERDYSERTGIMMAIIPALGLIGDPRSVPLLLEALTTRDDHWLAREAAAEALGQIGDPAAVPALINAAWMADTRDAAIGALARIGDPRAVEVLASALSDELEPATSIAAADGLVAIGAPSAAYATGLAEEGYFDRAGATQRAWVDLLGRIDARAATELLTALAAGPDPELAAAARVALE